VSSETWPSHDRIVFRSTPARNGCVAVESLLFIMNDSRHTMALDMLQGGVDRSIIALWLGHESVETTQIGKCLPVRSFLLDHST
jgi:hypothetical protein